MGTLIGDGGHADDIWETLPTGWHRVPHHMHFHPDGPKAFPVIIGINDPQLRAKVAAKVGRVDKAWVHPNAHLYHDVRYGYGTHINYGTHAVRTSIGNHTTIGPCVAIAGDVTIGDRVFIGIGACIGNLVSIGDDVVIGAGSVVLRDVPSGEKVLGVWARSSATVS